MSEMKIALVVSDDLSALLFCKGIIASLKSIADAEVCVICEMTKYRGDLAALGCLPVEIGAYRFFNPIKDLRYAWRLSNYFRENKIDIVFNFATKQNIYGTIAARWAGVAKIYSHVVGRGSAFAERRDLGGFMLRFIVRKLYRYVGLWSQKVWFTNRTDMQFFIDSGLISEAKAVISRNYLDVREYSMEVIQKERIEAATLACKLAANECVVVMVARMIWAKGIREYAEAAKALHKTHPQLKFVLIAPLEEGSHGAVPERYIRHVEQDANLLWLGFQEDVKAFYAVSELAVLPSYYNEGGYPRALLEPMSMGRPIIATDTDGCRGTVEEGVNGFLIPARDSNALAERIAKIMDDDDLRQRLGQFSREKACRDFDEKQIVPGALRSLGLPITAIQ